MKSGLNELDWTGERLVPGTCLDLQVITTHLHRYEAVAALCEHQTVLDLASGEGYGSRILSRRALEVTGVDIDPKAIAQATRKYTSSNLRFLVGDVARLPLPDASFDIVVSFETIEHLKKPLVFLEEIRRVLRPEGLLVMSTPNGPVYSFDNPYHRHEFDRVEFEQLLSTFFPRVELYAQTYVHASRIRSVEETGDPGPHVEGDYDGLAAEDALRAPDYFLAVCGNREVPRLSMGSYAYARPFTGQSEVSLFWALAGQEFSEERKRTCIVSGGRWQQVSLSTESLCPEGRAVRLRVDPACHPGLYRLRQLRVVREDGACLFPSAPEDCPGSLLRRGPGTLIETRGEEIVIRSENDDPQFSLPELMTGDTVLRCEFELLLERIVDVPSPVPASASGPACYEEDGLRSIHDHGFMEDPRFRRAYARGVRAAGRDYQWHWRVHMGLWASEQALRLAGDFVECGVNHGFLSSAIMENLDWDRCGKTFFLFDTFRGPDPSQASGRAEMERNREHLESGAYTFDLEAVTRNFSQWKHTRIVQGLVPDSLVTVPIPRVAFLHIDMNARIPEAEALLYFWDKLVPGALVLMDDYGYFGYGHKPDMDAVAARFGVRIASLPTGQGLLIKPPDGSAA